MSRPLRPADRSARRPAARAAARLGLAWLAASGVVLVIAAGAAAHRPPTTTEFRQIAGAVDRYSKHFYCARAQAIDVSTRDARWTAAFAISNCGSGSIESRFYLERPTPTGRVWRVVEVTASRGIATGKGPGCASRRVPSDIRCGVPGRS